MTTRVEQWRPIVADAVARSGNVVPVALPLAIIEAESSGTPSAYRGEPNGNGSIGLMQVLATTARSLGYTGPIGDPKLLTGLYDPATNIGLGVRLLSDNFRSIGTLAGAASAYNGGIRPQFGFGYPWGGPGTTTVCLARDTAGNCIQRRTVLPGEFGNKPYVDKVMAAFLRYGGDDRGAAGGGGMIPASDGQPDGGSPPPSAPTSLASDAWTFVLDEGWAIAAAALFGLGILAWRLRSES